jgi:hypothetical protein
MRAGARHRSTALSLALPVAPDAKRAEVVLSVGAACCHHLDAGPELEPNAELEARVVEACCLGSGFARNSKPLSSR